MRLRNTAYGNWEAMATCNLCPVGKREVPDDEMEAHLRRVHPEVEGDGTLRADDSVIVRDLAED
ncbi:hypothetical protein ACQPZJ_16410 [Actinoplanes sp. CA-054009]